MNKIEMFYKAIELNHIEVVRLLLSDSKVKNSLTKAALKRYNELINK